MSRIFPADARRVVRRGRAAAAIAAASFATACDAPQQIFSDASDAAGRVTSLTWFMIAAAAIVFAGVMVLLALAVRRNHGGSAAIVDLSERSDAWIVYGGALMPAIVLATVWVVSLGAMRRGERDSPALTIHVIAHQWWWEASYELPNSTARVSTANELHIPVGRAVRILLTSADVIHSFWVPRLQGKLDVIPGDTNDLRLLARTRGRYQGQCAEYCGMQHAKMGLTVVADDSATFVGWLAGQVGVASAPRDSAAAHGQQLFLAGACAQCHTIRGTVARGAVGPDLTHVASRATIAAGALLNRLGEAEAWIADAQTLKPGVKMPTQTGYTGRELRALAAYVQSLK